MFSKRLPRAPVVQRVKQALPSSAPVSPRLNLTRRLENGNQKMEMRTLQNGISR